MMSTTSLSIRPTMVPCSSRPGATPHSLHWTQTGFCMACTDTWCETSQLHFSCIQILQKASCFLITYFPVHWNLLLHRIQLSFKKNSVILPHENNVTLIIIAVDNLTLVILEPIIHAMTSLWPIDRSPVTPSGYALQ